MLTPLELLLITKKIGFKAGLILWKVDWQYFIIDCFNVDGGKSNYTHDDVV